MIKKSISILVFVLSVSLLKAQMVYEMGFTSAGVNMSDTVYLYSTYDMEFSIINNGSTTISDPIDILAVVNDTTSGISQTPRWLGGVSNIVLNPNDTFHFSAGVIFDEVTPLNAYAPGDNIVVIWPKADAPVTQSTQYFYNNLHVLNSISTDDFRANNNSLIRYQSNIISIASEEFSEVQIYSVDGRLLETRKEHFIHTEHWASGIYIITLLLRENEAQSLQILVN
jgi:hypothetical protein